MDFRHIYLSAMIFLIVVSATLLSGCLSAPPKTVYITKTVYQAVDTDLTTRVAAPVPIDKASYMEMPVYARESYLADYTVQGLKALHSCNAQLTSIESLSRQWKEAADAHQQPD